MAIRGEKFTSKTVKSLTSLSWILETGLYFEE